MIVLGILEKYCYILWELYQESNQIGLELKLDVFHFRNLFRCSEIPHFYVMSAGLYLVNQMLSMSIEYTLPN